MKRVSIIFWTVVIGLCLSLPAYASGFFVARFGGEHGHPTTDNPTAIYYNPAGLTLGKGLRLYLDGNFAWRTFTYDRPEGALDSCLGEADECGSVTANGRVGTPANALNANTGKGTLNNQLASPFIGATYQTGNWGFGVGLYAPFGGSSVYDKVPRVGNHVGTEDGPQRWWAIEGTIRTVYMTGAVAYRIPKAKLSIGLGLNLASSEVHTSRAKTAANTDDIATTFEDQSEGAEPWDVAPNAYLNEGRAVIDVAAKELSVGVGVLWEPADKVWVGVSYQSSPGFGESQLEGTGRLIIGVKPEETPDVTFYQHLPEVWQFGVRWQPNENTEYRIFGNYIGWSVLDNQCALNSAKGTERSNCETSPLFIAERQWEDAFAVRVGGSYWTSRTVELFLGAGFDQNAVPDKTLEPALFDTDKYTASAGARFVLMEEVLALGTTYTQVFYMDRDVDPADNINEPNSAGNYSQSIGVLNVNVQYSF